MKRDGSGAAQGGGSTAAVLWLMILLVFLPIVALHGIARAIVPGSPAVEAAP